MLLLNRKTIAPVWRFRCRMNRIPEITGSKCTGYKAIIIAMKNCHTLIKFACTLSWIVSAHHSMALSVLNGLMPRKNSYRIQPRLNQSTHSLYGTRFPAAFRRRISGAQSAVCTSRQGRLSQMHSWCKHIDTQTKGRNAARKSYILLRTMMVRVASLCERK